MKPIPPRRVGGFVSGSFKTQGANRRDRAFEWFMGAQAARQTLHVRYLKSQPIPRPSQGIGAGGVVTLAMATPSPRATVIRR